MKKLFSTIFFIMTAFFLFAADPIILDPKANNPFMKALAPDLHKLGIDVMQDWNSKVKTSMKPILAPLVNYPAKFTPEKTMWMNEFNEGVIGGLTAIKSDEAIAEGDFLNKWNNTEKEKRVFISFAREDVETAKKVKGVLEKKGYVAFIYLQGTSDIPLQSAFRAGEFMGNAGVHVVLDTKIARTKSGVMAEALSHVSYIHPTTVNYNVVKIYGTANCSRTRQAIAYFKETGATVKFYNVTTNEQAQRIVEQNQQYLEMVEGSKMYPLINVNGRYVMPRNYGVVLDRCRRTGPLR